MLRNAVTLVPRATRRARAATTTRCRSQRGEGGAWRSANAAAVIAVCLTLVSVFTGTSAASPIWQPPSTQQRSGAETDALRLFNRALNQARTGDVAGARDTLLAGLTLDPDNPDGLELLGDVEQQLGNTPARP